MTMTSDSGSIPGADATPNDMGHTTRQTSVYVYETPVRLWHWINAAAIFVLCVTGYFIGSPPPSMQIAEATHQFVFGYIRFAHFAAGWILALGFLGRIYWAIFGNPHARQLFLLPHPGAKALLPEKIRIPWWLCQSRFQRVNRLRLRHLQFSYAI